MVNLIKYYPATRLLLLAFGITLLALYQFVQVPYEIQAGFFIITVLITGIPHGALDHEIHSKTIELNGKKASKWAFHKFYHKYLFIYGALWLINPEIALLVFILISSFHFGEIDWIWLKGKNRTLLLAFSTVYGFVLLFNMFIFHIEEMIPVLQSFPSLAFSRTAIFGQLIPYKWEIFGSSTSFVIAIMLVYQLKNGQGIGVFFSILQTVSLLLIVTQLPIFLGFGFYFSCWHSLLTIESLKNYLVGAKSQWTTLFRLGFVNATIAILSVIFVIYWCVQIPKLDNMLAIGIVAVAVLTAPHMLVISGMFSKFKGKETPNSEIITA